MSFDSRQYLYLAQELAGKPSDPSDEEAKLRTAISRAYYSVFLKARQYLEENTTTIIRHDGTDHVTVRDKFKYDRDGKWRKIGNGLSFLLENRTFADYGEDFDNLPNLIEMLLENATRIMN